MARAKIPSSFVQQRTWMTALLSLAGTGCLNSPLAQIEDLGIVVAPYVDLDESSQSLSLITSISQSQFEISGRCGDPGGSVALIQPPISPTPTTLCAAEGTWMLTLNLSSLLDGGHDFKIRHSRLGSDRYSDLVLHRLYKITSAPTAPSPAQSTAGVQPASGGSGAPSFIITWEAGSDSAGQPLVGYEYTLVSSDGQTTYTAWTSTGSSTQAEITLPAGQSSSGSTFVVKIRGTDQANQTTPEQQVSVSVDGDAPTYLASLTNPTASVDSLIQGPNFSWTVSSFSDSGSGISHQRYRILNHSTGAVIRDWISLQTDVRALTPTGLNLALNTVYRFEIQGVDLAGNASTSVTSTWTAIQVIPTLVFQSVPATANKDSAWSSFSVRLTDGNGNTLSAAPATTVSLTPYSDASCSASAAGTLSGDSVVSSSGVASFPALIHNTAQTVYLKASAPGYLVACSSAIAVSEPPTGVTLTITSTSTSTGTNLPVKVTFDSATLISQGRLQSSCNNLRFKTSDGTTALSYWIEEGCGTSTAIAWVKVPTVPASSSTQILMMFDSLGAASQSNGDSVFPVFDDFSAATLNTSKWLINNNGSGSSAATQSIASSEITVNYGLLAAVSSIPGTGPLSSEARVEILNPNAGGCNFGAGYLASNGQAVHFWALYHTSYYGGYGGYGGITASGGTSRSDGWYSHAGLGSGGKIRISTSLRPTGVVHSVTPYAGATGYSAFTYTRSGSPNYTYSRKLYFQSCYDNSFKVDWVFGREIIVPEPTVSVGALN